MSEPVPESPTNEVLNEAIVAFTGCIAEALDDVCSVSLTMGDSYVPFMPDEDSDCEDEDDVMCSQGWVRVMNIGSSANSPESWEGNCEIVLSLNLEVGVMRCVPIPEDGEAPTETDVLMASLQALDDMRAILCAAMNCEVWDAIDPGVWSPYGPMGGQHGGTWTFSVEL